MRRALRRAAALALTAALPLLTSCAWLHCSKAAPADQGAPAFAHHFEERGTGRPIVFLHGFGASSYTWRYLAAPLSERYRVILVDLKGFGDSPKPCDGKYSVQDQADLICEFLEKQGLSNVTLVGNSLGGGVSLLVATHLARSDPERVSSLVLIDSIGYNQPLPSFINALRIPVLSDIGLCLVPAEEQARAGLRASFYDPKRISEDAVRTYARALRTPGANHALLETARQVMPRDIDRVTAGYAGIQAPTLIIWGRNDRIVPLDVGERLHAAIANSELRVIEECGHVPQEEKPEDVLLILEDFLRRQDAGENEPGPFH